MGQDNVKAREKVEELLHYGVRGMRWGVRRSRTPTGVTVSQKGRKRLKAVGGENQPASSEAVATKKLGQRAKKSGYQSLTNEELQAYNNRLNLEANAKRLDYQNKPAAEKFVRGLLGKTGKSATEQAASEAASKQVKKLMDREKPKTGFR
jgi:hypothetical protein